MRRGGGGAVLALAGLLSALFAPGAARAGGFEVAQQGAPAGGTAHAGAARSDEPVAAWFNPAALADGGSFRGALGIGVALTTLEAEAIDGSWSAETDNDPSTPPYLHASYAEDRWAVGLTANVAYGGGVRWPAEWDGRFEILSSSPTFFRFAPFFAWSFGDLRVAAGPHVDVGSLDIRRGLDFVDTEGDVHILMGGWGIGVDASVFWHAHEHFDLGLTYRSRSHLSLSGDADFTVPDAFLTRAPDQGVEADWTLPDRLVLGVLARLGDFRVLADLGLTVWSVNDELVLDFESENTPNSVSRNEWSTTVQVRGGVEWQPEERWILRAGAYFDPSPAPDETLAPSSPDMSRLGLTVGGGVRFGPVGVDLFYEYLHLFERESTSQDAPLARYRGAAHVIGIGAQWSGSPPEPADDVGSEAQRRQDGQ